MLMCTRRSLLPCELSLPFARRRVTDSVCLCVRACCFFLLQNKKCESLSYIESEVSSMKLLFERKESESAGKLELAQSEGRAEAERARQEQRRIEAELQQRTQQYQDAQNSVHQCEQEMRVIIVQLDKERKQRVQIKQKLEGLMPQL